MELIINGNREQIPDHCETVEKLLMHVNLEHKILIVEHNGKILEKSEHEAQKLQDGDRLEIVHFVGGG